MSVSVFAENLFEKYNLRKVYETSGTKYKGYFYADDILDESNIPSQILSSIDEASQYVNVLRIYAGNSEEIDPYNDTDQLMEDYLSQAGINSSQPTFFFIRGKDDLIVKSNDAFDKEYGENAGNIIDTQTFYLTIADDNVNSYETNTCLALVAYMNGAYDDVQTESYSTKTEEDSTSVISLPNSLSTSQSKNYVNKETNYQAVIQDDANLLKDEDSLLEYMQALTEYENVMFASTRQGYYSTSSFAKTVGDSQFGTNSNYTVFAIDMYNRQLYIYSSESMYKTITKSKANIITDNVYTYATDGDYDTCAQKAFEQILIVLNGDPLSSPMKLIGCILISLVGGLTICWLLMTSNNTLKKASYAEIEKGMGNTDFSVSNVRKHLVRTRFVKASSGGKGGGFGGGGFSGGGGGGGGHGF